MILIHPPAVRNCEPPVALGRLAGVLKAAGEPVLLIDGAREGMEFLLPAPEREDRKIHRIRETLTSPRGYENFDRYKRNLHDYINLLNIPVRDTSLTLTPADYRHSSLSPLKTDDLAHAAAHPEEILFYPWFRGRLKELLKGTPPESQKRLGLSLEYLSQALTCFAMLGYLKKEFPDVEIILGGSLISSWACGPAGLDFFKTYAHQVVAGRGEEAAVAFCGREYAGQGTPWYGDLPKKEYIAPGFILPYSAADSCSWKRCTFCAEKWENYPYAELTPTQAVNQLKDLVSRHAPVLIHFTDSEMSPPFMDSLIANPPGAPWYGFSRFLGAMTRKKYCHSLAASGCRMLCLGLESGDQQVLNSLKKGINLNQVSIILENLKEAGIGTYVYLLFGTPAENRDAAFRTRDFIDAHREYIDYLNLAVFSLPRISNEAETLETRFFYEGDLSLSLDFTHPEGWNRREVRRFLDREFRRNPELNQLVKRTPPVYTSNHAPFFL